MAWRIGRAAVIVAAVHVVVLLGLLFAWLH